MDKPLQPWVILDNRIHKDTPEENLIKAVNRSIGQECDRGTGEYQSARVWAITHPASYNQLTQL